MKILDYRIKLASFLIIIILIFGHLFVFNVIADFIHDEDDRVFFDELIDNSGFQIDDESCIYNSSNNGFVHLTEGIPTYYYDYSTPTDKIKVWESNLSRFSDDSLLGILSRFINPQILTGEEITSPSRLARIGSRDNNRLKTESWLYSEESDITFYAVQHFRFEIDQDPDDIEDICVSWSFGDYIKPGIDKLPNLEKIVMYVWTYGDLIERWAEAGSVLYNDVSIGREVAGEKLPDIIASEAEGGLQKSFISDKGYLDILILGRPLDKNHWSDLYTDYINFTVKTGFGYKSKGSIISNLIEPDESEFGGWENVIWNSSRYSTRSGITIEILDENNVLIDGFKGTISPLDISGVSAEKIRLKATFSTKNPKVTPYLYSWGVLYSKSDEFRDSFTSNYRISEMLGSKIENDNVVVSSYYSEWSFFGKNSDNTRAYQGNNIKSSDLGLYWFTEKDLVGGSYRAPVTSEGKVYIASDDKKIYAFDLLKDETSEWQKPYDVSIELMMVESSLAVYEDFLIAASGEPGGKNQIYALDKNNLSNISWKYPKSSEEKIICFSSAPTIDDGRLFITSWSGNFWDMPFLSFLSPYLGGNNQLIALDISTGSELWKPITLPTSSISSPAVGNGFVYVGCQNMFSTERYGGSLFAFDTETGEEIWNTTVGIIGRSSPVYADEKVFVLSNEKTNITTLGKYMLTAVDANNGNILWNRSMGEFSTFSLVNVVKSLPFLYKLIEGFAPISTPAYSDNTLFVLAPNGTFLALDPEDGALKWSYDLAEDGLFFDYYVTSPVVVGDRVYVISGDSNIYSFEKNPSTINPRPVWIYQVKAPGRYREESIPDILASPIISDNMIIISTTGNTSIESTILTGRVYCIGNYIPNKEGIVISTSLNSPVGKWYNKFNADYTNSPRNTVIFKILDEEGNDLSGEIKNLNKTTGFDISNISCCAIKLYAKIINQDGTEPEAVLHSWTVNYSDEKNGPVFDNNSYEPGDAGWINVDLEQCSIEVSDREYNGIISGLDIDSAKFKLGYLEKTTNKLKITDWLPATSEKESGVVTARIVANLAELDIEAIRYENITFTIKDLAGNSATSKLITFKTDTSKPTSIIITEDLDGEKFNILVQITATAVDTGSGDEGASGVKHVSLLYQFRENESDEWSNWMIYGNVSSPYNWEFGEGMKSGYYNIITRAEDLAGNQENINENKVVTFFFDKTQPIINNVFDDEDIFEELPRYNLALSDDYSLEKVYYRLDNTTEWTEINIDIQGQKSAEVEWKMKSSTWDTFRESEKHYIYFKVTDSNENFYETTKDNTPLVSKDKNITQLYLDLSEFSTWQWDDTYTISLNVPENMKVDKAKLFYQFSEDETIWTEVNQTGDTDTEEPFEWDFNPEHGNGYYRFYTEIYKTSGSMIISDKQTINVKLMPVTALIIYIILSLIFILVTLYIFMKMKRKK
jgi:outer membrane protein assembly factor BamB